MTALQHSQLVDAAYQAGLDESAIRHDYSGRGMYGARCFGLVHDTPTQLIEFALALHTEDAAAAEWLAYDVRQDGMGLSTITYWPDAHVEGVEADDDDE